MEKFAHSALRDVYTEVEFTSIALNIAEYKVIRILSLLRPLGLSLCIVLAKPGERNLPSTTELQLVETR
ncbi:MAG: hypothetical protein SVO26_05640 [Chloroflexota bacterium]|nr:hypothetical protein [Chloroflexota bacterium]